MQDPDADRQRVLRQLRNESPQLAAMVIELIEQLKAQTPVDATEEQRRGFAELEQLAAPPTRPRGHPDPWHILRRRLEGLRVLTSGDHVEIARLHRLVAAHLRERLAASDAYQGQRTGNLHGEDSSLGLAAPQTSSSDRAKDHLRRLRNTVQGLGAGHRSRTGGTRLANRPAPGRSAPLAP